MKRFLPILALILAFLILPSAAGAADRYVSPSGTLSWGQCTSPSTNPSSHCSLSTANSNVQAGDTILMRGGTYGTPIAPARSGTSNTNRITYTNYNDEVVTITGTSHGIHINGKDWISVLGSENQHIMISGTAYYIIIEGDADNNIVGYVTASDSTSSALWDYSEISGPGASQNWIHHVDISDCGVAYPDFDGHCLQIGNEMDPTGDYGNVLTDSVLKSGGHNPLQIRASYSVVKGNLITNDNYYRSAAVLTRIGVPSSWHLIEGNRIAYPWNHPTRNYTPLFQSNAADGIYRKNFFYQYALSGDCMEFYTGSNGPHVDRNYIFHNTFFSCGYSGYGRTMAIALWHWGDSSYTLYDTVIKNNIFEDSLGTSDIVWGGANAEAPVDIGNYKSDNGDPKFTDETVPATPSWSQPDFHLQSDSPCIDAATHLTLTNGAGSNSATLRVDDAHYFFSGDGAPWNIPSYTGITGDYIFIEGWSSPVEIDSINYGTNTINLASSRTWSDGAKVYLAVSPTAGYYGSGPDIGAFEYGSVPPSETCSGLGGYCCASPQTCPGSSLGSSDCPGTCCSQACAVPQSATYTALRAPSPPSIDGNPSEFANADPITLTNSRGTTATYRLLWDDTALYISAQASDDQLDYAVTQRDGTGIWNDDSIEMMFDTFHDRGQHLGSDDYKFLVNVGNVQHDSRYDGSSSSWNMSFTSAVSLDGAANDGVPDTGYSMEMAIPWSGWEVPPPSPEDSFGFELVLDDQDDTGARDYSIWANINDNPALINSPDNWGDLTFSAEEASSARSYQVRDSEDAIISTDRPDFNYGGLDIFYVGSRQVGIRDRVLLRFPGLISPDAVPQGSLIESATLTLTYASPQLVTSPIDLRIRRVLEPWTEGSGTVVVQASPGEATWDYRAFGTARWASDAAGDGGTDAGCSSPESHTLEDEASATYSSNPPVGQASSLDVTAIVQHWADSGESSNHGFLLIAPDQEGSSKNFVMFASSEFSDPSYRPMLTVELSPRTHRADASGDGCVDSLELDSFINLWYLDSTGYPMGELMEAVGLWMAGTGCSS